MLKLLYVIFSSKEEAITVAHKLLVEKLIACANMLDGSISIYNWQGEVQQQTEVILFAKTTNAQAQKAIERIKELHSYELPCIIVIPIESGFLPFIQWVDGEAGGR